MWNPESKTVGFPYLGRIGYYILRRGFRVFLEGREKSRGRVRTLGKKRPRLFLSHVSLLTRSIKTYPINLRLPCTLWLLRQHSIQTRQISSSSSWSSFSFPPCKRGWGVGEEGRHWWRMNGIHQNRPFFKMA